MHAATILSLLTLAAAAPSRRAESAPLIKPRGARLIEGRYIVKLKGDVQAASVHSAMHGRPANPDHVYNMGRFNGFASGLTAEQLEALRNDPSVSCEESSKLAGHTLTGHHRSNTLSRMPLSASRQRSHRRMRLGVLHAYRAPSQAAPPTPMTPPPARAPAPTSSTQELTLRTR